MDAGATCVKAFSLAASQYFADKNEKNLSNLQIQLEVLIGITAKSSGTSIKFFNPKQLQPTQCLTWVNNILCDSQIKPSLILKCIALLQNLAHDHEIRESLYDAFHITPFLAGVLKLHGSSAGDALTLECLQLLERVTYGHQIHFQDGYVEDLLQFIIKHILCPVDSLTQPCLGVFVNLCRGNGPVQSYIKNMENAKAIYKTLVNNFGNQNLTIIILSLSAFTSLCLQEPVGEQIYNARNINQTFQTIFNILMSGNSEFTCKHAVDLFKDLLKNPKAKQSFSRFNKLDTSIDNVLDLITSNSSDSVVKVFELLLSFCDVEGICPTICKILLNKSSLQNKDFTKTMHLPISQIKEPLIATVHWASQSVESYDQTPLYALDLLTEFYKEVISSNHSVEYATHSNLILPVVLQILQTKIESPDVLQERKCSKIVKALQLLIAMCGEESILNTFYQSTSSDLGLFTALLDYQLNNNNPALQSQEEGWSAEGIKIMLHTLELMEKLRRLSPEVERLFVRTLQDSRIVPFLSSGLSSANSSEIRTTLMLYSIGSALEAFPVVLLSDAMASNNNKVQNVSCCVNNMVTWKPEINMNNSNNKPQADDHNASIEVIIDKMRTGLEIKDIKSSEIIDIYEHKLRSVQSKEDQLQDMLDAKTLALSKADRMIAQYRTHKAQHEAETHKLRSLLQESEKRSEDTGEELVQITACKEKLTQELDELNHAYDRTTEELSKLQEEEANISKQLENLEIKHTALSESHVKLESSHNELSKENDKLKGNVEKLEKSKKQLQKQVESMEKTCQQYKLDIKNKDKQISDLKGDLEKQEQIAALIHSLSSGKQEADEKNT